MKRSFVIPVLDYSPKSSYNIKTLLNDLENIEGTVIVIFNSKDVAEELKDHPRIDYYSIMSHNLGVARAWNIGIDMSQTPVTFVLNADLHITKESVEELEDALIRLPDAAWVGPQGSFNNFFTLDDHLYFDKGEFADPIEIDAISGFYFAIKTSHFHNGILKFENNFTPCYYEEWDFGFQIKEKHLRAYIVPVTGYDHQFGGSILSMKKIKFMESELTLDEIHKKNSSYFHKKWYSYHLEFAKQNIHEFLLSKIVIKQLSDFIFNKDVEDDLREKNFQLIIEQYKGSQWPFLILGNFSLARNYPDAAKRFLSEALKENPEFEEAKEVLKTLE
ncbi:MAG: glycosyltransferase [Rhodothermaceae bacterium]